MEPFNLFASKGEHGDPVVDTEHFYFIPLFHQEPKTQFKPANNNQFDGLGKGSPTMVNGCQTNPVSDLRQPSNLHHNITPVAAYIKYQNKALFGFDTGLRQRVEFAHTPL